MNPKEQMILIEREWPGSTFAEKKGTYGLALTRWMKNICFFFSINSGRSYKMGDRGGLKSIYFGRV